MFSCISSCNVSTIIPEFQRHRYFDIHISWFIHGKDSSSNLLRTTRIVSQVVTGKMLAWLPTRSIRSCDIEGMIQKSLQLWLYYTFMVTEQRFFRMILTRYWRLSEIIVIPNTFLNIIQSHAVKGEEPAWHLKSSVFFWKFQSHHFTWSRTTKYKASES